jgi:tRNA(Ile)-lysidine synthase
MASDTPDPLVGALLERLQHLPHTSRYWVGYSGGADSTALLQLMHDAQSHLSASVEAVHFNHGLQDSAAQWQAHCEAFCQSLGIPFTAFRLDIGSHARASPEEAARTARYLGVARLLGPNDVFLTAHHADDQAETLLINLVRGGGVEGLAGIPPSRSLGEGWVARPLLDTTRDTLLDFLRSRGIEWLEDPSNTNTAFDRNFLRHRVFPLLEERWPGVRQSMARSARHARSNADALADLIREQSGADLQDPHRMPVKALLSLEPNRQALVLRQWLRGHEVPMLPEARLAEFVEQLRRARPEARPEVKWDDWAIRRYRDALWLQPARALLPCAQTDWKKGATLSLGDDAGHYRLEGPPVSIPANWRVSPRRPGDRLRPDEQGPSRKIKDMFQAAGVPPWLRLGIPVLYWDDVPVALGDWVLGHRLKRWLSERGLELVWIPEQPALAHIRRDCHKRTKTDDEENR